LEVAIGIDSHKSSLAAAAVDQLGRLVSKGEFANNAQGHAALLKWSSATGGTRRIGIECSATYGAALAARLRDAGEDVREVPTTLSNREARRKPSLGKSDPSDAVAIARVVAREDELPVVGRSKVVEDLKLLADHRDQLVRARTQAQNRIHKHLLVIRPGYEATVVNLSAKKHLDALDADLAGESSTRAGLIRRYISDVKRLTDDVYRITKEIEGKLEEVGTSLTSLAGVGPATAARILGEIGDVRRIRSKAAFAQMAGTAPLPASSGVTTRHRLNRGGNRKLNHALHLIAINRCRLDEQTKTYVARRLREGKTKREVLRCLKRHLASVVFRQLMVDARLGIGG
jgi:transposase